MTNAVSDTLPNNLFIVYTFAIVLIDETKIKNTKIYKLNYK